MNVAQAAVAEAAAKIGTEILGVVKDALNSNKEIELALIAAGPEGIKALVEIRKLNADSAARAAELVAAQIEGLSASFSKFAEADLRRRAENSVVSDKIVELTLATTRLTESVAEIRSEGSRVRSDIRALDSNIAQANDEIRKLKLGPTRSLIGRLASKKPDDAGLRLNDDDDAGEGNCWATPSR